MKSTLTFWLSLYLLPLISYAQAPPCGTNDPPGNTCGQATPICNLDGYCGTTDASYTVDTWGDPGNPITCAFFGTGCPTGLTGAFCSGIQNNSFLSFVASETSISFDVWVYNSTSGEGIQIMIFSAAGNCSGDVTSHYCNQQMLPSPNPQNVSATGLTIGQTYYIMIDGFSGDVADYTFSANSGVATPLDLSVGSNTTICVGESLSVTATGGDENYTWAPSPHLSTTTGPNVTITPPATPGTYTYTVTSGSGGSSLCPSSNEFTLTVTVQHCGSCSVTASNSNPTFCEGSVGTVNLTATGNTGLSYSWTGPNGYTSSVQNPTNVPVPSAVGSYTYTVQTTENGETCSASTTVTVQNCGSCSVTASNSNPSFCQGSVGTVNLTATGNAGLTYSWTGPNGYTSSVQNPTNVPVPSAPGIYTYTVQKTENGETCSASTQVSVGTAPNANAGGLAIITCESPTVQLNGSSTTAGVTFSWAGPGIVSGATTQNPTVNQTGTYTLTVTETASGCYSTSLVSVINDNNSLTVSAGSPQTITCIQSSVQLNGSSPVSGLNFSWTGPGIVSGGTTPNPIVNLPGTYTLTATHPSNGCTATASVTVNEDVTPFTTDAGSNQVITCTETSVQLNGSASIPNVDFLWSGPGIISGQTTPNPVVNQVGVYTLTATNPINGCTSSSNTLVSSSVNLPISDFTQDTLIGCQGLIVNFAATVDSSLWSYQWNFGNGSTGIGSTSSNQYNNSGCYVVTLTVTDLNNNCVNSTTHTDSICIIGNPFASFSARPQTLIVDRESLVNFTNSSTNANEYTWVFEDGTEQYSENASFDFKGYEPGSYSVHLFATNEGLCFDSTFIVIRIKEDVIFYVPNTFTPDGDEFNQLFRPVITSGIDIYNFNFKIYNRWGEVVWESKDPSVGWDGTYNTRPIQQGTYTWSMEFKLIDIDERIHVNGHLNLIR